MTNSTGQPSRGRLSGSVVEVLAATETAVRSLGFWLAIVLPLVYLPLLLLDYGWLVQPVNFTRVVGLHLVSVVLGLGYRPSAP